MLPKSAKEELKEAKSKYLAGLKESISEEDADKIAEDLDAAKEDKKSKKVVKNKKK